MSEQKQPNVQRTWTGYAIPIPTRDDFFAALNKVCRPDDPEPVTEPDDQPEDERA